MSRLFFLVPLSKQEATESIRVFPKESICIVCTLKKNFFLHSPLLSFFVT